MILETEADHDAMMAYAAALASVENITKTQTADTGKYKYSYADLGDVLTECKRVCEMHGLAIVQVPTVQEGHLAVGMWLIHKGGGQVTFDPLMMTLPKEAQAYGSALTYARRYQLLTVFGIAPEDDDGAAATTAAQTAPGRRTEAERLIREEIGKMDEETRKRFTAAFKEEFHSSLADLPAPRHGDALTWSRKWADETSVDESTTEVMEPA